MRYAITDIHQAAALEKAGIPAILEKDPTGKVLFFFEDPDKRFFEVLDEFNRDTDMQFFISVLKRLRGRMLDARNNKRMGNGYGHGYGEPNGNIR